MVVFFTQLLSSLLFNLSSLPDITYPILVMNSAVVFCAVLMMVFATVTSFPLLAEIALMEAADNDYYPMFHQYGNGYNNGYSHGFNAYNNANNAYNYYYNTNSYYNRGHQNDRVANYMQPQYAYDFLNYNMY